MGVDRRHRDWVVSYIADAGSARDDAGVGIDAEAGRQLGREVQGIAGRRGREMA